jgi:hypothetical protein
MSTANPNRKGNAMNNSNHVHNFDFDQWVKAVKPQLMDALRANNPVSDVPKQVGNNKKR